MTPQSQGETLDPGSTHSYVCIEQLSDKLTLVEPLAYDMHVTNPLGHSVRVNRVYKSCPLMVHDTEFSVDLIALPFHEFDLILGWIGYPNIGLYLIMIRKQ